MYRVYFLGYLIYRIYGITKMKYTMDLDSHDSDRHDTHTHTFIYIYIYENFRKKGGLWPWSEILGVDAKKLSPFFGAIEIWKKKMMKMIICSRRKFGWPFLRASRPWKRKFSETIYSVQEWQIWSAFDRTAAAEASALEFSGDWVQTPYPPSPSANICLSIIICMFIFCWCQNNEKKNPEFFSNAIWYSFIH